MKKLSLLLLMSILLVSCISVVSDGFSYTSSVAGVDIADVLLVPQGGSINTSEYVVTIKNKTTDRISIDWNASTIFYNGESYTPFLEGKQDLLDGKTNNSTILEPQVMKTFTFYSSGQVYASADRYEIKDIPTANTTVELALKRGEEMSLYRFDIKREMHETQKLIERYI